MQIFLVLLSIFSFGSIKDNSSMIEIGQYQNDDVIITYGQTIHDDGDIDGALYIVNTNDELSNVYLEYDDLGVERFIFLADIGNNEYIAVCERYFKSDEYQLPVFKDVILIKYDIQGNRLGYISYDISPISYSNHNHYLVVCDSEENYEYIDNNLNVSSSINLNDEYIGIYQTQYQGSAFVDDLFVEELYIDYPGYYNIRIVNGDYEYSYSISIIPIISILGNQFEDMYMDEVTISSLGDIYINDSPYLENESITIPGNYIITVYGLNNYIYQEEFILLPSITYSTTGETVDFLDGIIVDEPIKIFSNGISMLLDGEPYYSEKITESGNHSIIIYGINGMQYTLSFTVIASVSGVINGGVYTSVNFTVYGEVFLNGEAITGDIYLDNEGSYKLEILDNYEVYETIYFEIESILIEEEDTTEIDINFNYIILVFIAVGGYLILRKK